MCAPRETEIGLSAADIEIAETFERLTLLALGAEEADEFIQSLLERKELLSPLVRNSSQLDPAAAERLLSMEGRVVKRLEEEKKKVLLEMEQLYRSKTAINGYAPRFPLPMAPVFFNKTG